MATLRHRRVNDVGPCLRLTSLHTYVSACPAQVHSGNGGNWLQHQRPRELMQCLKRQRNPSVRLRARAANRYSREALFAYDHEAGYTGDGGTILWSFSSIAPWRLTCRATHLHLPNPLRAKIRLVLRDTVAYSALVKATQHPRTPLDALRSMRL